MNLNPHDPMQRISKPCAPDNLFALARLFLAGLALIGTDFSGSASARLPSAATLERATTTSAGGGSFAPIFSGDGQTLVFVSFAKNLVPNQSVNEALDVFARHLPSQQTILISRNSSGLGGGNDDSSFPTVSSNGLIIAFESWAGDLVPNDTNGARDIFVRDLAAGTTRLVSRNLSGSSSANGHSRSPVLSANGRFAAFSSTATDLIPNDTNELADIFLHNLETEETIRLSPGLSAHAITPAINADGSRVAFATRWLSVGEIYRWNAPALFPQKISGNVFSLLPGVTRCFSPAINADGRFVAFKAAAPGGVALLRHDVMTGELELVSAATEDLAPPVMSSDGRWIAYTSQGQVFLWDGETGLSSLISGRDETPGNAPSYRPSLSAGGRIVAFVSEATNLVDGTSGHAPRIYVRNLDGNELRLASADFAGEPAPRIGAYHPILKPDGSAVAFESASGELVENDLNDQSDLFLRDLASQVTQLVSARAPGLSSQTAAGFHRPNFSGTERSVVFSSHSPALVPGDQDEFQDVYVHDLWTRSNILVSVSADGVTAGNGHSRFPAMSGDGRFVAFLSEATNLAGATSMGIFRRDLELGTMNVLTNSTNFSVIRINETGSRVIFGVPRMIPFDPHIFWWDVHSNTTYHVTLNASGNAPGGGQTYSPILSRSGRWVAFSSTMSLLPNVFGSASTPLVYLRDLDARQTFLLSKNPDGAPFTTWTEPDAISGDERLVAFSKRFASPASIYVHDIAAQTNLLVCTDCSSPAFDGTGSKLVYASRQSGVQQIVLHQLATDATSLVSVGQNGFTPGNGDSSRPVITRDGRYVVYTSHASNLVPNDSNQRPDIFVRDTLLGVTTLVSMNKDGTGSGAGASLKPVLASDGRTVFFYSYAPDLIEADYNQKPDIYALRLGAVDSDGDGMDDDWEMAYFGTLARDGTGDFDGDGHTDLEEFLAGTDPTDANSILRAMLLLAPDGTTTVLWHSVPGKSYRVEFKDGLDEGGWVGIPGVVQASGLTSSLRDETTSLAGQRFYRVLVLP
jgi:Tol biopolymer transport system component